MYDEKKDENDNETDYDIWIREKTNHLIEQGKNKIALYIRTYGRRIPEINNEIFSNNTEQALEERKKFLQKYFEEPGNGTKLLNNYQKIFEWFIRDSINHYRVDSSQSSVHIPTGIKIYKHHYHSVGDFFNKKSNNIYELKTLDYKWQTYEVSFKFNKIQNYFNNDHGANWNKYGCRKNANDKNYCNCYKETPNYLDNDFYYLIYRKVKGKTFALYISQNMKTYENLDNFKAALNPAHDKKQKGVVFKIPWSKLANLNLPNISIPKSIQIILGMSISDVQIKNETSSIISKMEYPFGMHRGELIHNVPKSYFKHVNKNHKFSNRDKKLIEELKRVWPKIFSKGVNYYWEEVEEIEESSDGILFSDSDEEMSRSMSNLNITNPNEIIEEIIDIIPTEESPEIPDYIGPTKKNGNPDKRTKEWKAYYKKYLKKN